MLFKPADAIRGAGGATITYLLRKPAEKLTIEILDAKGQVAQTIQGAPPGGRGGRGRGEGGAGRGGRGQAGAPAQAEAHRGGRRRRPRARRPADGIARARAEPRHLEPRLPGRDDVPGNGAVGRDDERSGRAAGQLSGPAHRRRPQRRRSRSSSRSIRCGRSPTRICRSSSISAIRIRDKVSEANNAVIQIRNLKREVADRLAKSPDAQLKTAGDRLTTSLSAVEEEIYQVKNQSGQDPLNFPIKINNRLASLLRVVNTGDGKPIANAAPILKDLSAELKVQTDRLQQVLAADLPAFNAESQRVGVGVVTGK